MLIAFPAISILAGSCLIETVKLLFPERAGLQKVASAIVAVLLLIAPARKSIEAGQRLALPDTRLEAKVWVEENIPPGSKIVMDSGKYYFSMGGPPLTPSRRTLERLINRGLVATNSPEVAKREGTRRVAYFGEDIYFQYQLSVHDGRPGYDIFQILHDVASKKTDALTLEEYLREGVQYAIINKEFAETASRGETIYESIRARGTLLKQFRASSQRVGPALAIYKLH